MQDVASLRRVAILGAFGFIVLSVWGAYDLVQLEQGRVASVRVHWLIAMLYDALGFWPAVLVFPVLGVFAIASIMRRMARMRAESAGR